MSPSKKKIAITCGDLDGVGFEITAKALKSFSGQKDIEFHLYRSDQERQFSNWGALAGNVLDLPQSSPPAVWVEKATQLCLDGQLDALVTGPISKTGIQASGRKDVGHTGIFRRLYDKPDELFMLFWSQSLIVLLLTDHIALRDVPQTITQEKLTIACKILNRLLPGLSSESDKPIGVLGLNPHNGEEGLMGCEENIIPSSIKSLETMGIHCLGPLVPDVAFQPGQIRKCSAFVAMYHDQGLIPFKAITGHEGIQITAGLPFIRTSVDHGTGKDIYGKDMANPASMTLAIKKAIDLINA
jgi:4-hydroxythreonine-4-phosphate dehydrogenase